MNGHVTQASILCASHALDPVKIPFTVLALSEFPALNRFTLPYQPTGPSCPK